MLLQEGLTNIQSQKKPWLLFGESFTLTFNLRSLIVSVTLRPWFSNGGASGGSVRGWAGRKGPFPLDTCPLHFVDVTLAELIGFTFTLVYVLTSTRSAALCVFSVQLRQSGGCQS